MLAKLKSYALSILVCLTLTLTMGAGGYLYGHHKGYSERDQSALLESFRQQNEWSKALQEERNAKQKELNEVSKSYQEKLANLEADTSSTLDGLRKSNRVLRVKVSSCETGGATSGGRESDGTAELSEETSRFLIGESKRADAWIEALQRTVRTLQAKQEETYGNSK